MKAMALTMVLALVACSGDDEVLPPADAAGGTADAASGTPDAAVFGDGLPMGAIAWFRVVACPTGWSTYAPAVGRTIVPSSTNAGAMVGAALVDAEERAHGHAGTVTADLPSVSYAGAPGGGNGGVAASGLAQGGATLAPATAALPYLQLLPCKKLVSPAPAAPAPPAGLIAFFEAGGCPTGWTPVDDERRLLVGLPEGGTAGASFGGAPLGDGEVRQHAHPFTGQLTTTAHGIALASGGAASGYAQNGSHALGGNSSADDVAMPFVQLRACAKQ